jgi:hypothetical protein
VSTDSTEGAPAGEWLASAREAIAAAARVSADDLALDQQAVETLLRVAAFAAHESGERTNAPLLCYLIGRADSGGNLEQLCQAVEEVG